MNTKTGLVYTRKMPAVFERASNYEKQLAFGKKYKTIMDNFNKNYTQKGLDTTLEGQEKFVDMYKLQQQTQNTSLSHNKSTSKNNIAKITKISYV
jgi:hypothetical protein